jgi:hypothetical protein
MPITSSYVNSKLEYPIALITATGGGEPDVIRGEYKPRRRANKTDLDFASTVFEVFTNDALSKLYTRTWHKSSNTNFLWSGRTEIYDASGNKRIHLHIHSYLQSDAFINKSSIEVENLLQASWTKVGARNFKFPPEPLHIVWAPHTDLQKIAQYVFKHCDLTSVPARNICKRS